MDVKQTWQHDEVLLRATVMMIVVVAKPVSVQKDLSGPSYLVASDQWKYGVVAVVDAVASLRSADVEPFRRSFHRLVEPVAIAGVAVAVKFVDEGSDEAVVVVVAAAAAAAAAHVPFASAAAFVFGEQEEQQMDAVMQEVSLAGEGFPMGESKGLLSFLEPWTPAYAEEQRWKFQPNQMDVIAFAADSVAPA
jgi:hypothetical protein